MRENDRGDLLPPGFDLKIHELKKLYLRLSINIEFISADISADCELKLSYISNLPK